MSQSQTSPTPLGNGATPRPARKVASAAAAFLLLACAIAACWLGWRVWSRTASGGRIDVLRRDPADHVQHLGYTWNVVGGLGRVTITRKPPKSKDAPPEPPTFEFHLQGETGYNRFDPLAGSVDYLTPEQLKAWDYCYRLNTDRRLAKRIGLSPEQVQKLQEMRAHRSALLKLTQGEKDRLAALFEAYHPLEAAAEKARSEAEDAEGQAKDGGKGDPKNKAAKAAGRQAAERARDAAEKLEDAVEELAREKLPPYRKYAAEMTDQLKALLSAEQMKKLEQGGR